MLAAISCPIIACDYVCVRSFIFQRSLGRFCAPSAKRQWLGSQRFFICLFFAGWYAFSPRCFWVIVDASAHGTDLEKRNGSIDSEKISVFENVVAFFKHRMGRGV